MLLGFRGSLHVTLVVSWVNWCVCKGSRVGEILFRSESYLLGGLSGFKFIAESAWIRIFFACWSLLRLVRLHVGPVPDHFGKEGFSKYDHKHYEVVEGKQHVFLSITVQERRVGLAIENPVAF